VLAGFQTLRMLIKARSGLINAKLEGRAVFARPSQSFCCVPGTAHVLKGESNIHDCAVLGKSQAQPGGGEGRSAIATGIR
jgi:hypothetical protein